MSDDHVYMTLAEGHEDDTRWAYGTGFEDPLHGVDTAVPEDVDPAELAAECVALADDALVSAQRLAEWTARAPELEEEVALANIGLDLIGQARLLYSRAGQVDGTGRGEDAYAYFRDAGDFRNVRLAELPCGDFAFSIVRMLLLSSWRLAQFQRLTAHADPVLAAIATKGAKELAYHRQYAAEWAVRLGDGTPESHRRMRTALEKAAPYLGELFTACDVRENVVTDLRQVTEAAGLPMPVYRPLPGSGRHGDHTEHLAPLLAELQSVARAHPEAAW
ncbi:MULTISPECIES: 1,2-phenylacetyl-CoA epoxidase subunit PaaC [unclassified Streptomyces]|uniref:1,2-phenylacetyl-CoA epoxidase subunit PaaC n=1 Tax=unclassified Streptomyces TaxID=2593676 RepID=UPI001F038389|nr:MULTISPECIES: 1,2-phenylacetyl-CoA epoxidase subunit PaaC [unclassified Streptomyces]MCH0562372.1 phenylacetate-CoA oxygenase subunit PaaC [Streptomyces sp. MUM 2J]MCH0570540.1 phenylacetate-CoA oxygenase subunit PaaC [Streptomyces sp. MUM 136J]